MVWSVHQWIKWTTPKTVSHTFLFFSLFSFHIINKGAGIYLQNKLNLTTISLISSSNIIDFALESINATEISFCVLHFVNKHYTSEEMVNIGASCLEYKHNQPWLVMDGTISLCHLKCCGASPYLLLLDKPYKYLVMLKRIGSNDVPCFTQLKLWQHLASWILNNVLTTHFAMWPENIPPHASSASRAWHVSRVGHKLALLWHLIPRRRTCVMRIFYWVMTKQYLCCHEKLAKVREIDNAYPRLSRPNIENVLDYIISCKHHKDVLKHLLDWPSMKSW